MSISISTNDVQIVDNLNRFEARTAIEAILTQTHGFYLRRQFAAKYEHLDPRVQLYIARNLKTVMNNESYGLQISFEFELPTIEHQQKIIAEYNASSYIQVIE